MRRTVYFARLVGCAGLGALLTASACSTPRPYTGWDASQSGIGGSSGAGGRTGSGSGGTGSGGNGSDASGASGGITSVAGLGGAIGGVRGGDVGATGGVAASGGVPFGTGGASAGGTGGVSKGSGGSGTGGSSTGSGGAGGFSGSCAADEKRCNGMCVKVADPTYGCTLSGCTPCAFDHVAQAVCQSGACGVGACSPGFMNCDARPDCETDITSPTHCGGCATTCSGNTPICAVSGPTYACSSGCPGSQVRCSGVCTDLTSDVSNCMACGKVCTIANGTSQCTGGTCVPESCATGYTKCGSACQYTDGDINNCGGCNLKCPSGALCKGGLCEVRVGYPNRFLDNQDHPFSQSAGTMVAFPIAIDRTANLIAFGYINESNTVGAVASFGLYNSDTTNSPTKGNPATLLASSTDVMLKGSVQEVTTTDTVLQPGNYYFSILIRDEGEPKIYSSAASQIEYWLGPQAYSDGLPISFASTAPEAFPTATPNIYLVVRQAGQ